MQRGDHALIHLKESLEINRNILLDDPKYANNAMTLSNISTCLKTASLLKRSDLFNIHSLEIKRNI